MKWLQHPPSNSHVGPQRTTKASQPVCLPQFFTVCRERARLERTTTNWINNCTSNSFNSADQWGLTCNLREHQRRTPSLQTPRPHAWHPSVTAHPLLFLHPRKEIIAVELRSITRQVGGSCSMIKVCMVSNTKTGGACGGSTCQWAYRVSSSSRHRSCRIFSAHTHAHQEHFGEAGEKALHTVWRRCGLAEFCFVCYILSKIILYVCVKKLSDSLLYKRLQRHVSV